MASTIEPTENPLLGLERAPERNGTGARIPAFTTQPLSLVGRLPYRRPVDWLVLRYVDSTAANYCLIGIGGQAWFPLYTTDQPVVLRGLSAWADQLTIQFSAESPTGYLAVIGA